MNEDCLRELADGCRPLMNKFYRAHGSMRVPAGARCWVAGAREIEAALCLSAVAQGHWLTGLLVAPSRRHQGLGSRLLSHARTLQGGPIWLFCAPPLYGFYEQQGFRYARSLPEPLAERLRRYNQSKTLIALEHDNREENDGFTDYRNRLPAG